MLCVKCKFHSTVYFIDLLRLIHMALIFFFLFFGSNFHFVFFCINNVKSYDGSEIYTTCKFMPDKDSKLQGQRQRTLLFSAVAEVRISIPFSCACFLSPNTQRKI